MKALLLISAMILLNFQCNKTTDSSFPLNINIKNIRCYLIPLNFF